MKGPIIIGATVAGHLRAFHLPWVRHLRNSGFKVIGVARDIHSCQACKEEFDEVASVSFARSIFSVKQLLFVGRELRDLSRRARVCLVHLHTPNAAFWGRCALRQDVIEGSLKVAYTAHGFHFHKGGEPLTNWAFLMAERLAAPYTNALITINQEDYDAAKQFRLAPKGFVELVPGAGLDLERFEPDRFNGEAIRAAIREELRISNNTPIVLMVAEFITRKRQRDLIEATARCTNANFQVVLVGEGPELGPVKGLARQLGLESRVRFLGFRRDIPELIAASDLVALPSSREGLPFCVMEALAMQKPVIGANARGTRDLLSHDCGWLYKVGDTQSLAHLIDYVLGHPEQAICRASAGRQMVLRSFGWGSVKTQLIDVYQRLGFDFNHGAASGHCLASATKT